MRVRLVFSSERRDVYCSTSRKLAAPRNYPVAFIRGIQPLSGLLLPVSEDETASRYRVDEQVYLADTEKFCGRFGNHGENRALRVASYT